jgi:hypothetical protein
LRTLKEDVETAGIRVLVSTAYHNNEAVVHKLGGEWLPKPWNHDQLLGAVRGVPGATIKGSAA